MEFLWGAAISAQQTEEHTTQDWRKWYRKNGSNEVMKNNLYRKFLYKDSWKSEKIGSQLSNPKSYKQDATSIVHEDNYKKDYKMLEDIGLNSLRFSIPWSKIQPNKNKFDEEEIKHYRDRIITLHDRGIEPIVTLWHFDQPSWFSDMGGWHSTDAFLRFGDYVKKVVDELGDLVKIWTPLNEPNGWIYGSYIFNKFPPENTKRRYAPRAYRNIIQSQKIAYDIIKDKYQESKVGIATTAGYFEPYNDSVINKSISDLVRYVERDNFLDKCEEYLDFIGVNNYYHYRIDWMLRNHFDNNPRSDMKWILSPEGLAGVAEQMYEKYEKPVVVTEHGLADHQDKHRAWYIQESLEKIKEAKKRGVEINGYIHWSLIDNIEWTHGRWPRFGLIEIDYDTGDRQLRESARKYGQIIKNSEFSSSW